MKALDKSRLLDVHKYHYITLIHKMVKGRKREFMSLHEQVYHFTAWKRCISRMFTLISHAGSWGWYVVFCEWGRKPVIYVQQSVTQDQSLYDSVNSFNNKSDCLLVGFECRGRVQLRSKHPFTRLQEERVGGEHFFSSSKEKQRHSQTANTKSDTPWYSNLCPHVPEGWHAHTLSQVKYFGN